MDGPMAHFQNCHVGDGWAEGNNVHCLWMGRLRIVTVEDGWADNNNFCCLWMGPWRIITVGNGWAHGNNFCCLWMSPCHIFKIVTLETDEPRVIISVAYRWPHG